MPKTIPTSELQEGMILKNPVLNKFGQVLLREGTELKLSHQRVLQLWGINFITIETNEPEQHIEVDEKIIERANEILKSKIPWEPRNKYEKELIDLARKSLIELLVNGEIV